MKTIAIILAALAGGFVAGLLLSEVIGIGGMLLFGQAMGIKYLPIYLALLAGGAALLFSAVRRQL